MYSNLQHCFGLGLFCGVFFNNEEWKGVYLVWEIATGVIASQHQAKTMRRYTKQTKKTPNQDRIDLKPTKQ